MFENPRRCRQARNFTTNVPEIQDLKSSSEQIFSENWRWVPLKYWANKLPVHSCLSSITFNYITFFSIIRYACAIVGCRSGLPHASSKTCSLRRSRVSPSRVPVFSCAHYFQVPATQATKPAAFLPRFLIIFGLVSCSDRVTKNGDDLELPISRNKGAEVTYFFFYSL